MVDINNMTPDQVRQLVGTAQPRLNVQFGPYDMYAILAFEAAKLVKLRDAVESGSPLPTDVRPLLAITDRMAQLARVIANMTPPAPSSGVLGGVAIGGAGGSGPGGGKGGNASVGGGSANGA
jgi:uncharacterized membrane protein YgcG